MDDIGTLTINVTKKKNKKRQTAMGYLYELDRFCRQTRHMDANNLLLLFFIHISSLENLSLFDFFFFFYSSF